MNSKTDVLSFDTVFKQMKDNTKPMLDSMGCPELLGDIIDDIETNRRHFKSFFEAGQQSKQDEIDELKMANHNLSAMSVEAESYSEYWKYERDNLQERVKELELINFDSELHFDAAKEHIDHLQKKIDLALEKCYTGIRKQGGDYYLEVIQDILKGEEK